MLEQCKCCGTFKYKPSDKNLTRAWWHLNNYFGLNGLFCPDCYSKVAHDGFKNPKNPEEYLMILMRMKK